MPFIALNEFDEEVTAFQCRDEYLRNGTEYTQFRCAFCEVKYFARAIYVSATSGKAPHFYQPDGKHEDGCNGEPIIETAEKLAKLPAKRVVKREYEVPEKLVHRTPPRKKATTATPGAPPTRTELERRRKAGGAAYGVARYTSSLLQSFVEAKKFLVKMCYAKASEKKLDDKQTKELLAKTTPLYPLQLFGEELNYDSAFWSATTIRQGTALRNYYATGGVATTSPAGLEIRSLAASGKADKVAAVVQYEFPADADADRPRAHQKLLDELAMAAASGKTVDWHAYGVMDYSSEKEGVLVLASLDHLYIKIRK